MLTVASLSEGGALQLCSFAEIGSTALYAQTIPTHSAYRAVEIFLDFRRRLRYDRKSCNATRTLQPAAGFDSSSFAGASSLKLGAFGGVLPP